MLSEGLLGLVLSLAGPAAGADAKEREARDAAFWQGIVAAHFKVPEGESPAALMSEVSGLLASPDPRLRDTYGYGIAEAWIYREPKLSASDVRALARDWTANLRRGIGSKDDDTVFLRSFSALDLSLVAALDLKQICLTPSDFAELLDAALAYLAAEKDLRAYDPQKGWIHATAHTADLLKFLARNDKLPEAAQEKIVGAIEAKLRVADVAFTHGEDERLASALASLLVRADAAPDLLVPWLAHLKEAGAELWRNEPFVDPAAYRSLQNQENCLKNLHVILSVRGMEKPLPSAASAADERILEALKGL